MGASQSYIILGLLVACSFLFVINVKIFRKEVKSNEPKHADDFLPKDVQVRNLRQVLLSVGFIKTGTGYCKDIVDAKNKSESGVDDGFDGFLGELKVYERLVEESRGTIKKSKGKKEIVEGYSAQLNSSLKVYWRLASLPFVNTVCETGFNAGHSAFLWLMANPKLHVYSFDIGTHKYSRTMASYLQKEFPQRLDVTWGDSTKTLPVFHSDHSDIKCDLVVIDGGHSVEVAKADFDNFYHFANKLHVVLMDDHPAIKAGWSKGPREAWEGGKLNGKLYEFGGCTMENLRRGISLGYYMISGSENI